MENAKIVASLAGPFVTVIGFWFVWQQLKNTNSQIEIAGKVLESSNIQNKTNQNWKRAEFIANEIKNFYQDPVVMKVLQIIDYNDRRYDIGMLDINDKPCLTRITQSKLEINKLQEHTSYVSIEEALESKENYTTEEAVIRDYFDTFLYYIERFERFLTLRLISEDEIFPYLEYYIDIFRGRIDHVDNCMKCVLSKYIKKFRFEYAHCFFYKRFSENFDSTKYH